MYDVLYLPHFFGTCGGLTDGNTFNFVRLHSFLGFLGLTLDFLRSCLEVVFAKASTFG